MIIICFKLYLKSSSVVIGELSLAAMAIRMCEFNVGLSDTEVEASYVAECTTALVEAVDAAIAAALNVARSNSLTLFRSMEGCYI
jgi:hypothetical protein